MQDQRLKSSAWHLHPAGLEPITARISLNSRNLHGGNLIKGKAFTTYKRGATKVVRKKVAE
jgi:hypothetical protein